MDFDIICLLDCDDCGRSVIIDPEYVTIFVSSIENEPITAVSICSHCESAIVEDIDLELAFIMYDKNVKVLSWFDGEEIDLNEFR